MSAKFRFEKLPLEKDDVLLVTISEKMTDEQVDILQKTFTVLQTTLPHNNQIILSEFGTTIQALRPLQGKIKVINEVITVVKEEDLVK